MSDVPVSPSSVVPASSPPPPVSMTVGSKEGEGYRVEPKQADASSSSEVVASSESTPLSETPSSPATSQGNIPVLPIVQYTPPLTPIHPSPPASSPSLNLPLSDQKILSGTKQSVAFSVAWLALWCVKKLKKAHLALRVVNGKVSRVVDSGPS